MHFLSVILNVNERSEDAFIESFFSQDYFSHRIYFFTWNFAHQFFFLTKIEMAGKTEFLGSKVDLIFRFPSGIILIVMNKFALIVYFGLIVVDHEII